MGLGGVSPLTICPAPNCGRLTTGGRCAEHRATPSPTVARNKAERQHGDGRNTQAWRRTRRAVLNRDDHACTILGCGDLATHVHKITGGTHTTDPDDYQSLCARHHGAIHGRNRHRPGGAQAA